MFGQDGGACQGRSRQAGGTACKAPYRDAVKGDAITGDAITGRCTMSAALTVRCIRASESAAPAQRGRYAATEAASGARPPDEVAFYRKYAEGMLRRYMYRSMEIGR